MYKPPVIVFDEPVTFKEPLLVTLTLPETSTLLRIVTAPPAVMSIAAPEAA